MEEEQEPTSSEVVSFLRSSTALYFRKCRRLKIGCGHSDGYSRHTCADTHHRIPSSAFPATKSCRDHRRRAGWAERGLRVIKRGSAVHGAGGEQSGRGDFAHG